MNKVWRWILGGISILALFPIISAMVYLFSNGNSSGLLLGQIVAEFNTWRRILLFSVLFFFVLLNLAALSYAIFGDRFRGKRASTNDFGFIEIGAGAIENIALNSARASQAGIKSAKANVQNLEENKIALALEVILYSDVEIPQQMLKIQERVKKDVEKYTGISVDSVQINVKRVELIGNLVDRK